MQYKMALSDEGSFQKDEWGPWLEQWVHHNDPTTGRIELVKVLRSDPAGVRLMKSYPDIGVDPGITPWADDASWKREKVFADLARWEYTNLSDAEAQASRSKWASFAQWHTSHQSADTLVVGQPVVIGGRELRSPLLSWHQMWRVLKTNVNAALDPTSSAPAPSTSQGADTRRVDRQELSSSTSAAEVNIVTHPGYTEKDRRIAKLRDHALGTAYLTSNLSTKGALFLIKLEHPEGELAVGLGRRTFDATLDDDVAQNYAIEWFERKNKRVPDWGKQPGFRLCVESIDSRRRRTISSSMENFSDFVPIAVAVTPATVGTDEPSLSQDCMVALREYVKGKPEDSSDEEASADESTGKRKRKSHWKAKEEVTDIV